VERVGAVAVPARARREDEKGLGRSLLAGRTAAELDLVAARSGAPDIARRRVREEVLAGAIEPARARLLGGGDEAVPRPAVDLASAHAARVAHDDGDVVARVGDDPVQE